MTHWLTVAPAVTTAFLAATVEFVEALTIVLVVGLVRGWRSALGGTLAGVALLALLVLVFGTALQAVPLPVLRLVVGTLALLFGVRWLRKAILRAAGVLALRDEDKAFRDEQAALRASMPAAAAAAARPDPRAGFDLSGFVVAFKGVVLEGLEVVFIVIAFGANAPSIVPAATGAGLALLMVVALGLLLHRPLARVPENTLKLFVGVMLSAFGAFWVGESVGIDWPLGDASIVLLMAVFGATTAGAIAYCAALRKRAVAVAPVAARPAPAAAAAPAPSRLAAALAEAIGLFVDDGALAAGTAAWIVVAWASPMISGSSLPGGAWIGGLCVLVASSAARRAKLGL
jgi:uncharacterized membrane protein